jgi:tetratricopeptide (TPR) repeat protein
MTGEAASVEAALKSRLINLSRAGYKSLEKNRLEEASGYFSQILALDPHNCYALVGLGELARKRKDPEDARRHYQECLRYEPENLFALKAEAECARELRDYTNAVESWQRCLSKSGEDAALLTHIGDGFRKLGQIDSPGRL